MMLTQKLTDLLTTKRTTPNENYTFVWDNLPALVSPEKMTILQSETLQKMHDFFFRYTKRKYKIGYGWSGSKDSLVLGHLLSLLEIPVVGVQATIYNLEYPEFLNWSVSNRPENVFLYSNDRLNIKWLADNLEYLFPSNSKFSRFWALNGPRRCMEMFCKNHDIQMLVHGNTRVDGNWIPSVEPEYAWGCFHYMPLANWKLHHILTYLVKPLGRKTLLSSW